MTWAPWSYHGVTMKLMVSRFINIVYRKNIVIPAESGNLLFLFVPVGCHFAKAS